MEPLPAGRVEMPFSHRSIGAELASCRTRAPRAPVATFANLQDHPPYPRDANYKAVELLIEGPVDMSYSHRGPVDDACGYPSHAQMAATAYPQEHLPHSRDPYAAPQLSRTATEPSPTNRTELQTAWLRPSHGIVTSSGWELDESPSARGSPLTGSPQHSVPQLPVTRRQVPAHEQPVLDWLDGQIIAIARRRDACESRQAHLGELHRLIGAVAGPRRGCGVKQVGLGEKALVRDPPAALIRDLPATAMKERPSSRSSGEGAELADANAGVSALSEAREEPGGDFVSLIEALRLSEEAAERNDHSFTAERREFEQLLSEHEEAAAAATRLLLKHEDVTGPGDAAAASASETLPNNQKGENSPRGSDDKPDATGSSCGSHSDLAEELRLARFELDSARAECARASTANEELERQLSAASETNAAQALLVTELRESLDAARAAARMEVASAGQRESTPGSSAEQREITPARVSLHVPNAGSTEQQNGARLALSPRRSFGMSLNSPRRQSGISLIGSRLTPRRSSVGMPRDSAESDSRQPEVISMTPDRNMSTEDLLSQVNDAANAVEILRQRTTLKAGWEETTELPTQGSDLEFTLEHLKVEGSLAWTGRKSRSSARSSAVSTARMSMSSLGQDSDREDLSPRDHLASFAKTYSESVKPRGMPSLDLTRGSAAASITPVSSACGVPSLDLTRGSSSSAGNRIPTMRARPRQSTEQENPPVKSRTKTLGPALTDDFDAPPPGHQLPHQAKTFATFGLAGGSGSQGLSPKRGRTHGHIARVSRTAPIGTSCVPESHTAIIQEVDRVGWSSMQWADSFTLLHWAAECGRPDLCLRFLARGADPDHRDDSGRSAYDYARESGSSPVLAVLSGA